MRDAAAKIAAADVVVRRITVPEGMTSAQVGGAAPRRAEAFDGEIASVPAEGALLPDTYDYSPRRHAQRMLRSRMRRAMTDSAGRALGPSAPPTCRSRPRRKR